MRVESAHDNGGGGLLTCGAEQGRRCWECILSAVCILLTAVPLPAAPPSCGRLHCGSSRPGLHLVAPFNPHLHTCVGCKASCLRRIAPHERLSHRGCCGKLWDLWLCGGPAGWRPHSATCSRDRGQGVSWCVGCHSGSCSAGEPSVCVGGWGRVGHATLRSIPSFGSSSLSESARCPCTELMIQPTYTPSPMRGWRASPAEASKV